MAEKKYVCSVCGYVYTGDKAPEECPQCHQKGVFVEEKKGRNTNGNLYTFAYATVIVVLVAVLLAVVSQVLSPRQQANVLLDQQKQILVALNQDYSETDPAALYQRLVVDTLDVNGAPVFVANIEGETKFVLKLHGAGLWGGTEATRQCPFLLQDTFISLHFLIIPEAGCCETPCLFLS